MISQSDGGDLIVSAGNGTDVLPIFTKVGEPNENPTEGAPFTQLRKMKTWMCKKLIFDIPCWPTGPLARCRQADL